ncbi:short-chain dehydrogenase [Alsobacter soli]|uniref:Short-chain dehydrogenase n=1 Tax=Alsobacter soli TaxID=2109933 RepID=A0A2T1HVC6_9HYPH|nr:SDR family NAD(P)-dependent oxidoreductase [Alsobacter soli]PSC05615.1 short-chain dehydrogenase [Alsobacter soli]
MTLTVLVTGASSGIGRATAIRLARVGYRVLALARNREALDRLASETGAEALVADLADPESLERAVRGRAIDVLVNNAGLLSIKAPFQETPPEAIAAHVVTNVTGPLTLTRLVLPQMVERRTGHVLFVTSIVARVPHPDIALYAATKAALAHFSDSLRCDLLGTGVRVTDVAPGRVQTELYRDALDESGRQALYEGFRNLQPDDVAEAIAGVLAAPDHVNISRIEVNPTEQAAGGSRIVSLRA